MIILNFASGLEHVLDHFLEHFTLDLEKNVGKLHAVFVRTRADASERGTQETSIGRQQAGATSSFLRP